MFVEDILARIVSKATIKTVNHKLYAGNRVYFVDSHLQPHTGTVDYVMGDTVGVTDIANNTFGTDIITLPSKKCIKTMEIYLGKPGSVDTSGRFVGRTGRDLSYERMPKLENSTKKNPFKYFQVDESMYMLVSARDDEEKALYKVKSKSFGTDIVYYLEDTYGDILYPINVACKIPIDGVFAKEFYLQYHISDEIGEWLDMVNGSCIDFTTQVLEVFVADNYTLGNQKYEFSKNHMTPIWKKHNIKK